MINTFTDQQLGVAVRAIQAYDAVVVVGAGLSAYGYPMTAELAPLVWRAIDADPDALRDLDARTGLSGQTKETLSVAGDINLGWQLIRDHARARSNFQHAFEQLDRDRIPSAAHRDIARLIRLGRIEVVISYNWDSCLERAYEEMFGVHLPQGSLFKPHGDVVEPHASWTLPDEAGLVPEKVLQRLSALAARPRSLVVIGYSGSDEVVVEKLLKPLESSSLVVRVGPSARGEGAVPGTADKVLAALVLQLEPSEGLPGWRYVTFRQHRDFSAALRGERLRPMDVDACPELPQASRLADRLRSVQFATVSGPSGSGKSITAFHAARRLNQWGWAVVQLARPGVVSRKDLADFGRIRGPVLAVVDDAQAIDPAILADFDTCVDGDHAVLLVSTERLETRNDETVLASQAQQVIFDYCKANIEKVGPLLSSLDSRVGKSRFLESPLQRLEMAKRSTTEPWSFMFAASGGDRRISSGVDKAVENNYAAIVFAVICIAQMTSQDAGVSEEELMRSALLAAPELFSAKGEFRKQEFEDALRLLKAERLISSNNGRLRASHIRAADQALRELGRTTEQNIGPLVMAFVRHNLMDPHLTFRGKLWLLRTFDSSETYRGKLRESFLDGAVVAALLDHCSQAAPGSERGTALYLMWDVNHIRRLNDDQTAHMAAKIMQWLPTISADESHGFHWMLGGIRSNDESLHAQIRKTASARMLGQRLAVHGSRRSAASWAYVLRELSPPWPGPDFLLWCEQFREGLDEDSLHAWLSNTDERSRPYEIYELISQLAFLAPAAARGALGACMPNLIAVLEEDLVAATDNFATWAFGTMTLVAQLSPAGGGEDDEEDEVPGGADRDPEQAELYTKYFEAHENELRQLASEILTGMNSVNWVSSARSLEKRELYELESLDLLFFWLAELSVEIMDRIAEAISPDWLHKVAAEEIGTTNGSIKALSHILQYLAQGPRGKEVVRAFLARRDSQIQTFPEALISLYPDIAANRILNGGSVAVQSPSVGGGWGSLKEDLEAIASADLGAAKQYLRGAWNQLIDHIQEAKESHLEGITGFFDVIDSLDPMALDQLIGRLDQQAVQTSWGGINTVTPEAIKKLLLRAARATGPVGEIARALLQES